MKRFLLVVILSIALLGTIVTAGDLSDAASDRTYTATVLNANSEPPTPVAGISVTFGFPTSEQGASTNRSGVASTEYSGVSGRLIVSLNLTGTGWTAFQPPSGVINGHTNTTSYTFYVQ